MKKFVLLNGKVYVGRGVFAQAVYAEDGVIRCVGTDSEALAAAGGGAETADCEGRTVIPGLNDSHCHQVSVGINMSQLNVSGTRSAGEITERGRKFLAGHPELCRNGIAGRGWNQDLFTEDRRVPDRHDLDRITTDVPIVLRRVCGHIAVVNTKALDMMGMDRTDPPEFEGGTFEREADGHPNGVLTELLVGRAGSLIPPYGAGEYEKMYERAANYAVEHGVTTVQSNDAGSLPVPLETMFSVINNVHAGRRTLLRYRHQLTFRNAAEFKKYLESEAFARRREGDPHVEFGPLKLFKDGSLGGRSALMRQDYADDPGNRGVEVLSGEEMDALCKLAADAGVQVTTHAIGDRAVADTISSYERTMKPGNPLRNIVNHCQITDRALLERMARDNICVAYQPIFLDYDMHITESRCGPELASTSYAFGTLDRMGVHIGYGTDAPVEDSNPFPNICCAVTRTDKEGWPKGGWFPAERVDVETAVDAYTAGSAWLEFHEQDKGRIRPGFLADMTVLDTDIFTCDPGRIRDILPTMTVIGGEVAYRR